MTAVGAEAGFWLLWLIILGCVIKVFVQVVVGRCVILTGNTTLRGIGTLPGWKPRGIHWIIWFRVRYRDRALEPSLALDIGLWLSGIGLLIAGVWMTISKFGPLLGG